MKKVVIVLLILLIVIVLSGCSESSPSKNQQYAFTDFMVEDINNGDYFEGYLKEARTVKPSEIIAKNVNYVVYRFLYKNQKPDIIWYDNKDQKLEYLSYYKDTVERTIYTDDYQNESLPSKNTNGDTMIYREPISKYVGYCLYDEQGRVITEFSCGSSNSSELYQYSYRSDGKISRETYIEIDYYDIDWENAFSGSSFSEDEANDAVFESVHLNYFYDDYIYDSNKLLLKTEHYIAGEEKPISYEKFEYNNENQLSKSYYGRYEDNTIGSIDYYKYYK